MRDLCNKLEYENGKQSSENKNESKQKLARIDLTRQKAKTQGEKMLLSLWEQKDNPIKIASELS